MEFNLYFSRYLDKNGIKKAYVARLLNLKYGTFISKLDRNSFTYSEVLFLDAYYKDLNYVENYNRSLVLRGLISNGNTDRGCFRQEGDITESL